jgi:very-short-patch-repair endonuclease
MPLPGPDSHVISDKSAAPGEVYPRTHENHAVPDKSALAGSICQFRQVIRHGDPEIARVVGLQHGQIHRQQLYAAGIGRGAIAHRLQTGRLHQTFPSVYRLDPAPPQHLAKAMAAALHCRGNALVAELDAAELFQMLDTTQRRRPDRPVEMLLVARTMHPIPGIRMRRVAHLARQDIRWRYGIPVTSPARIVLDIAAAFDDFELEAALAAAIRRGVVRPSQLRDVIQRNPYAKGVRKLATLLDAAESPHDTRSDYERRLLALIRSAELPLPLTNTYIGEHMVDMLWPDLKLVIEFDSWAFHGDRSSFEKDRLRDQVLSVSGHHVMRVTARQIDHTPTALVARIAAIITARQLSR